MGNLTIHQVLHGYSEGHRLLSASLRLPRTDEHEMLVLSDLSGPAVVPGYSDYLTGYAIASGKYYVLARTWYAPEMKRPGCVWTHSMIIAAADLGRMLSVSPLRGLFRRPTGDDDFATYASPLEVELNTTQRSLGISNLNPRQYGLVAAVYEAADQPVYFPSESSAEIETVLLAVWEQQWPRLRRAFQFSTGSIADRNSSSRSFDVQAVPISMANRLANRPRALVVPIESSDTSVDSAPWLRAVTADLREPDVEGLRTFLRDYAADTTEPRFAFKPLVETFLWLRSEPMSNSVHGLIANVVRAFPEPSTGVLLKELVLKPHLTAAASGSVDDIEGWMLESLAHYPTNDAFQQERLRLSERADRYWRTQSPGRTRVLAAALGSITGPGSQIRQGVLRALTPAEILELQPEIPQLLYKAVLARPVLTTQSALWRSGPSNQEIILEALSAVASEDRPDPAKLAAAVLARDTGALASRLLQRLGPSFVRAILDESQRRNGEPLIESTAWRESLAFFTDDVLRWLADVARPSGPLLLVLAASLDPNHSAVYASNRSIWLNLRSVQAGRFEKSLFDNAMGFALALGLGGHDDASRDLVAMSFEPVHRALCDGRLSSRSWHNLRVHLPDARSGREWDRAESLRIALLRTYVRRSWGVSALLRTLSNTDTLRLFVESCRATQDGQVLLRSMREAASDSSIAGAGQASVIAQAFARKKRRSLLAELLGLDDD